MPQRQKSVSILGTAELRCSRRGSSNGARKKWKNGPCVPLHVLSSLWPTGAFFVAVPGNRHYCSAAIFFMDLDRDLPEEEFAAVEWCSDAFVGLLEELKIVYFLYTADDCVEKIVIAPQNTNVAGNHNEACPNSLIVALFQYLAYLLDFFSLNILPTRFCRSLSKYCLPT